MGCDPRRAIPPPLGRALGLAPIAEGRRGMVIECRVALVHRVCSWCRTEFARETWLEESKAEITTWGMCSRCLECRLREEVVHGEISSGGCATGQLRGVSTPPTHTAALGAGSS